MSFGADHAVTHQEAYPTWQHKPLFDIRRIDVNQLLDVIKHKHGRNQADAVLSMIRSVMNWYAVQDDRYSTPIVKGMKRDQRSGPERSRKRILNDDEIRAVWGHAPRCRSMGLSSECYC